MKKEIRLYFNLDKDLDIKAYEEIGKKKSASAFIIDLVNEELKKDKNLIAEKLDSIVYAINNLQLGSINSLDVKLVKEDKELKLDLMEEFDDEY